MGLSAEEREVDRIEDDLANLDPRCHEARKLRQQLYEIARYQGDREEWEQRGFDEGWL